MPTVLSSFLLASFKDLLKLPVLLTEPFRIAGFSLVLEKKSIEKEMGDGKKVENQKAKENRL